MNFRVLCSAAVLCLAAASTANAASYIYSITDDSGVIASGDFTTDASNDITALTGNLSGSVFSPTGAIAYSPNPGGSVVASPSGFFDIDDVYYPAAATGASLTMT